MVPLPPALLHSFSAPKEKGNCVHSIAWFSPWHPDGLSRTEHVRWSDRWKLLGKNDADLIIKFYQILGIDNFLEREWKIRSDECWENEMMNGDTILQIIFMNFWHIICPSISNSVAKQPNK